MADRILIIDDDEALRDSLQLVLSAEGYQVAAAAGGREGLCLAEDGVFDAILCDLRMPGIDGLELLPELVQRLPGTTI
jgi:CheY-like chemotaxis protein